MKTPWNKGKKLHYPVWIKGKHHSEETRKKISLAGKGRKSWNAGKTGVFSRETLEKMSAAKKGKKLSAKHAANISAATKGKKKPPRSAEWRRKQSAAHKGQRSPMEGKRHTPEAIAKMSGPNNVGWKGGITPVVMRIRNCPKMKQWRVSVWERDGYTCVWCQARNGNGVSIFLQADHIKEFHQIMEELRATNPVDLYEAAINHKPLWDITNGRTLCLACHNTTKRGKIENLLAYARKRKALSKAKLNTRTAQGI